MYTQQVFHSFTKTALSKRKFKILLRGPSIWNNFLKSSKKEIESLPLFKCSSREFVYTMFNTNNYINYQNLIKHQKVLKYYKDNCLQKFLLFFMSLLTSPFAKNSHNYVGIYFISLKNVLKQTWKSFIINFQPQWKDQRSSFQLRQILAFFWNLLALIFS